VSDTPSIFKKLAVRLLGLCVVLPVLLVTGYWGLFAVVLLPGMIYNGFDDPWDYQLTRMGLVIVTAMGLWGVYTGLRLYRHFLQSTRPPAWARSAWAGLACGTVANLAILAWFPESLLFLGWPLIGSAAFALLLLHSVRFSPRYRCSP